MDIEVCPNCKEKREEGYEICWNCQYNFVSKSINAEDSRLTNSMYEEFGEQPNYIFEAGKDLMVIYKAIIFQIISIVPYALIAYLISDSIDAIQTFIFIMSFASLIISLIIISYLRSAASNFMKFKK